MLARSSAVRFTGRRSGKLLHHDPVAPDFVQIKLDRCGSFRRLRVRRLDLAEDVARQQDRAALLLDGLDAVLEHGLHQRIEP